jgi:hypothetical protein
MTKFDLKITDEVGEYGNITELHLGDAVERFATSLSFWSAEDYRSQWLNSIGETLQGKQGFLLESLVGPVAEHNFVIVWVMYPVGDAIYFQERLLELPSEIKRVDDLHGLMKPLETVNEDGEKISTWKVERKHLDAYFRKCKRSFNCGNDLNSSRPENSSHGRRFLAGPSGSAANRQTQFSIDSAPQHVTSVPLEFLRMDQCSEPRE